MSGTPEDILRDRLERRRLGHKADAILGIAAACIWLATRRADDDALPVGVSKLGGMPDLPQSYEWPLWRGEPMAFIAQIRLDEAAPYDVDGVLPHTGLLSFFFATDCEPKGSEDDDDPTSWRVLHLDGDPTTFTRQPVPANLPEPSRFAASSITFSRWLTLPTVDGPEYQTLSLTDAERNAYIDIEVGTDMYSEYFEAQRIYWGKGTYLLGHPYTLNSMPLLHSYVASRGLDESREGDWYTETPEEWEQLRQARLARERIANTEWRLLFQTDGGASGMDWAGGGLLHVTIACEALRQHDFTQVWMDIDFV